MTSLWDFGSKRAYLFIGLSAPTAPVINTLWYNPTTDQFSKWTGQAWAPIATSGGGPIKVSPTPPASPPPNGLWYNPTANAWYLWDGAQWQLLSFGDNYLYSGSAAPTAPITNQLWFDPATGGWRIWDGAAWVGVDIGG